MDETDSPDRCGIGIRGVAMAIDTFAAWLPIFMISTYAIATATGQVETTSSGTNAELTGTLGAVGFATWIGLGIAYHTLCEWRYGKTLGKHLVAIRAVEADGSSLSLRSSLVRNLLRIVDWLPFFYLIGIVAVAASDEHERIGDRLAGTAVVRP